jgi:hypothetical protein
MKYIVTIYTQVNGYEVEADSPYEAEQVALSEFEEEFGETPYAYMAEITELESVSELNPLADFAELEDGWDVEDGIYTDDEFDSRSYLDDFDED